MRCALGTIALMSTSEGPRIGIIGAAGRGGAYVEAVRANGGAVVAICDAHEGRLAKAAATVGVQAAYSSYEQMLDEAELDAVVVGTPVHFHVPQAIAALERGVDVLCEVPVGTNLDECKQLTRVAAASPAMFMLAENYNHLRTVRLVTALVQAGLFGTTFYAEGEYIHELKAYNEVTPWRRDWQTGPDGITYPTHSLGPILRWMPGERLTRVCCEAAGYRYADPRGKPFHQAMPVMLGKTSGGGLVKLRVDLISDRPHAMTNYQLQGVDGAFESARGASDDKDRIWVRSLGGEMKWHDLRTSTAPGGPLYDALPPELREDDEAAKRFGHGGGDYHVVREFFAARQTPDARQATLHAAMDMSLPGLVSQLSIAQGGAWLDVPDSREWFAEARPPQLRMTWPSDKPAPAARLPADYALRQYTPADCAAHRALMEKVQLGTWDDTSYERVLPTILPDGFFLVEHLPSCAVVATTTAHKHRELGWVAADPAHAGKGLGRAVVAAALARLLHESPDGVYLSTDDYRLPAIKTYLDVGFVPDMSVLAARGRWRDVNRRLASR